MSISVTYIQQTHHNMCVQHVCLYQLQTTDMAQFVCAAGLLTLVVYWRYKTRCLCIYVRTQSKMCVFTDIGQACRGRNRKKLGNFGILFPKTLHTMLSLDDRVTKPLPCHTPPLRYWYQLHTMDTVQSVCAESCWYLRVYSKSTDIGHTLQTQPKVYMHVY